LEEDDMKRWMTALGTLAVTVTSTKCAPVVIGGGSGGESSGSENTVTGASGTGGPTTPASTTVIAILVKDLPTATNSTMPSLLNGPWGSQDPDALVLMFSNEPEPCASPTIGGVCSAQTEWQSILVLPPDLVRVGLVDLANPRIAGVSFTYFDTSCSGGGGGGQAPGGTMEIVSTDAGSITVNLIDGLLGSAGATFNGVPSPQVTLQGAYTASRCEAAPPPPPPAAAVAISGAKLPAGLPSSPTIGASPDPTALYLFLGSGAQTCGDPLSPLGCTGEGRITLRLPAALQQPGTLDLSDPELAGSIEIAAEGGTANCTTSLGSFTQGTLTITSLDASGISFSLYQSLTASPSGPAFDGDGQYRASLCP
jgi:hypothetical protein